MSTRYSLALLCIAGVLSGCSGVGSVPPAQGRAGATESRTELVSARFRIKVPHRKTRRSQPAFVSPSTEGVTIALAGPTKASVVAGLTPSSPGCVSGLASTVCSLTYELKPGKYTATIATYDAVSCTTTCTIPTTAKKLSVAQKAAFKVVAGAANSINLILAAIPAVLSIVPSSSDSVLNAARGIDLLGTASRSLIVEAFDADSNLIFGAGSPAYTVKQTSGTLSLKLTSPTAASPNVFQVTPPASYSTATATVTVSASYAGQATNGCAQGGAVCSLAVTFDMKELLAVANANDTVGIFQVGASTPYATLTFGIANPQAIAFDSSANLIVANCLQGCSNGSSADNIAVFPSPYTGVPSFISDGIYGPHALVFDGKGDLFVANAPASGTGNVTEYAPPFSNGSAPTATTTNGIDDPVAVALDGAGNLWVANCFTCAGSSGDTVTSYASPYTGAPVHTLFHSVSVPRSIAIDAANDVFVANLGTASVVDYVAPAYADTGSAPTITTVGSTYNGGNLSSPVTVRVDGSNLLIADNGSGSGAILQCGPPFQSAAPNCGSGVLTLQSGVDNPQSILLDGAGSLFVANRNSNTVTAYAPPSFATFTTLASTSSPFAMAILP